VLALVLLVFGFVLLVLAAMLTLPADSPWRSRLGLLGLACWILSEIVTRVPGLAR
jgi:hypothetical protein